jgi:hypothetical protein
MNGFSDAPLHLNILFAKFTIFAACIISSQLANSTSNHSNFLPFLFIFVFCQYEHISDVFSSYLIHQSKCALNTQKWSSSIFQLHTSASTFCIASSNDRASQSFSLNREDILFQCL